jgi:hypothetical protein
MNKENFNKNFEGVVQNIREYINLKTELYSLILIERFSKMFTKFLVAIIFAFFLFFVLLFLSLGFIHWFHEISGTTLLGYIIAAIFYLILGLIVYGLSKKMFLNPMLKGFTDVLFEEEDVLESKTKTKVKDEADK